MKRTNQIQTLCLAWLLIFAFAVTVYLARRVSTLRTELAKLHSQHQQAMVEMQTLRERKEEADLIAQKAKIHGEEREPQTAELLKLRAELARQRASAEQSRNTANSLDKSDPFISSVLSLVQRASDLRMHLEQMPDKAIPELQWLTENDWLTAAKTADLTSDVSVRQALKELRRLAKERLYPVWQQGLQAYTKAHGGQLPVDTSELKPYFEQPIDDAILQRYKMLRSGQAGGFQPNVWLIGERAPVDKEYDTRLKMGWGTSTIAATGVGQVAEADY